MRFDMVDVMFSSSTYYGNFNERSFTSFFLVASTTDFPAPRFFDDDVVDEVISDIMGSDW